MPNSNIFVIRKITFAFTWYKPPNLSLTLKLSSECSSVDSDDVSFVISCTTWLYLPGLIGFHKWINYYKIYNFKFILTWIKRRIFPRRKEFGETSQLNLVELINYPHSDYWWCQLKITEQLKKETSGNTRNEHWVLWWGDDGWGRWARINWQSRRRWNAKQINCK